MLFTHVFERRLSFAVVRLYRRASRFCLSLPSTLSRKSSSHFISSRLFLPLQPVHTTSRSHLNLLLVSRRLTSPPHPRTVPVPKRESLESSIGSDLSGHPGSLSGGELREEEWKGASKGEDCERAERGRRKRDERQSCSFRMGGRPEVVSSRKPYDEIDVEAYLS